MGKLFILFIVFLHLLLLDLQGNVAIIKSLKIHLLNDTELRSLTNIKTYKHFFLFFNTVICLKIGTPKVLGHVLNS